MRRTYSGLVEKIPYLQDLGITAVELLPVFNLRSRMLPLDDQITGGTIRYLFSPSIEEYSSAQIHWMPWTNFGIWSKPCIAPASR